MDRIAALHLLLAILMLAPLGARAQADVIHKCVAADGTVSYQSAPCAASSTEDWARAVADFADSPAPSVAPTTKPTRAARPVRTTTRSGARNGAARQRCAAEQRRVAAEREERWMRLNIDDLRKMDARITRACRAN